MVGKVNNDIEIVYIPFFENYTPFSTCLWNYETSTNNEAVRDYVQVKSPRGKQRMSIFAHFFITARVIYWK